MTAEAEPATEQRWNAGDYARNAGFVPALGRPLLHLLNPTQNQRILDLGCGDGVLTQELLGAGCTVVGVDASETMVEAARARGIDARVMNGEALTFNNEFDAVVSNAALHWMRDADAVIRGVFRALKPGGRFVGEMGGHGNVARIRSGLADALERHGKPREAADPWFFPTDRDYATRLERAGFRVVEAFLFDRPTPLPTGLRGWLQTFAGGIVAGLDAATRDAVLDEAAAAASPYLTGSDGPFADYVRLRFVAEKPA